MAAHGHDVKLWLVIEWPEGRAAKSLLESRAAQKLFFKGENEELLEIELCSIHLTPNEKIFRKCN